MTSDTANLPKVDILIPEPEPERESSSSDKEEDIKQIITEEEKPKVEEPKINKPKIEQTTVKKPMLDIEWPELEAEYCFAHKDITYQGYFDPTKDKIAYQKEIDSCISGLKGDKLDAVKAAFISSLHFYPKKDWDKFLQPQCEYTPGDSATAAYKTLTTKIMGFLIASVSSAPIPPKPHQPPWNEHSNPEGGEDGGKDSDDEKPNSPSGNRGDNPPDGRGGGPPGGSGSGGGGPGGPPPRPQQLVVPIQGPSGERVKIKAPDVFNWD